MDLRNIIDDIALVDLGHLAANLVHELVATIIAFDGLVQLTETLVGVGQCHGATCLVERVINLVVVRNADFGILHHMLEVVIVEEIKNHGAQHLQFDFVLVGVGLKVGLAA